MDAVNEVLLDGYHIRVTDYKEQTVDDPANGKRRILIMLQFVVSGREHYHDVTVLLYNRTFDVEVPERKLRFRATIHSYATSIPNAAEPDASVDFKLGLIETD
ncbi:YkvR family protein [Paenibacillus sp. CC-CFT747]|nr:YkvR family protein [Paenibacillus sp. CC-CFT747]